MKYSILGKIYFWSKEIFGPVTQKLKREWNRIWIKMLMFSNSSLPHRSYALFRRYCSLCNYTVNQFWNNTLLWCLTSLKNPFSFCTKKSCVETELNCLSSLMFKLSSIIRKSLNYRNLVPNIVTSPGLGKK